MIEVTTLMTVIQASVRLYGAASKAFSIATTARPIDLPLPAAGPAVTVTKAFNFFDLEDEGKVTREKLPSDLLEALLAEGQQAVQADAVKSEQIKDFFAKHKYYLSAQAAVDARVKDTGLRDLSADELLAALRVYQWSKMAPRPGPSALQTLAGTLVNVAVDYFVGNPDAISDDRPQGRALKAFLTSIQVSAIDFSRDAPRVLVPQLMRGLFDTVSANPDVLVGGPKGQAFVTDVTTNLTQSLVPRLEELASTSPAKFKDFVIDQRMPALIARAFFEGAARAAIAHPQHYLGAGTEAQQLVKDVIQNIVDLVVDDQQGLDLDMLASTDGLEQLVKTALGAVAENPTILGLDKDTNGNDRGIALVISQTLGALTGKERLLAPDLLPEVLRLVLERTGANLALVVRQQDGGKATNLLIEAGGELLAALSERDPVTGKMSLSPVLTRSELLTILEHSLDRVIDNPGWIAGRIAGSDRPILRLALDAALVALRQHSDAPISSQATVGVLQAALSAVAINRALVEVKLDAEGELLLTAAVDAVLEALFVTDADPGARWRLAGNETLVLVVHTVIGRLAHQNGLDERAIPVLQAQLGRLVNAAIDLEALPTELDAALTQVFQA